MGCGQSKRKFIVNADIQGKDETCLELFSFLGLVESEIDSFYTCFSDIDTRKSASIQPAELFSYFSIELGPFESALFSVFDDDKSGKLTFLEFVCAMWNYLSMPVSLLGALVYMIKDRTGVMCIRYSDVKEVVELMHKKRVEGSPNLQTILSELKNNYSVELSIQDICKWSQNNQSILSPIIILQLKFRKQLIGEKYWQAASESRLNDHEKGTVGFIKDLSRLIRTKSEEIKQNREHKIRTMKAQSRNANLTGAQANIARKQSILLSSFGLSQQSSKSQQQVIGRQSSTLNAKVSNDLRVKSKPSSSSSSKLVDPSLSPKQRSTGVVPTDLSSCPSGTSSKKSISSKNVSNTKNKSGKTLTLDSTTKEGESKSDEDENNPKFQRESSVATASLSSKKRPQSAKANSKKSSSKFRIEKSESSSPDSPGGSPVVPQRPKTAAMNQSNSKKGLVREDSKVRKSSITEG